MFLSSTCSDIQAGRNVGHSTRWVTVRLTPSFRPASSDMIVQKLSEIQKRYGYLPPDEMRRLSKEINEPLHRLHEVASFYPLYRLEPPPAVEVQVCRDISCHLHGAPALEKQLAATAGARNGEGGVRVCGVSCLGQCDHAPAVMMAVRGKEYIYFGQSPEKYAKLLESAM